MEETKQGGANSTEELHTKGGYQCTIMEHPKTGEELVIRECFDRWQLVDDGETEAEHKMRKKLLNAFKKKSKQRGTTIHQSVSYDITENGIVRQGHTYVKNPPVKEMEEDIEEVILDLKELGAKTRKI